jgi:hypothetical protein
MRISMARVRFRERIKIKGINPYVLVSHERANVIRQSWRGAMPVTVRLNQQPELGTKTNLIPKGDGSFYLYLNTIMRKAASVGVGDEVVIQLEADPDYRAGPAHPLPRQFNEALKRSTEARRRWRALPPSRQKEILRYFATLKTSGALERNVAKAVGVLLGEKARFMAREWNQD